MAYLLHRSRDRDCFRRRVRRPPDVHRRAEIGFSLVGNDQAIINSKLDKMVNLAEDLGLAEIIDTEMEIIHL